MSTAFDPKKNYGVPAAAKTLGNSTRTWRNWKTTGLLPDPIAVLPNGVDVYRGSDLNKCAAVNGGRRQGASPQLPPTSAARVPPADLTPPRRRRGDTQAA